ncbi:MAG: IS1 family transposase [Phormidesmis sp. CAN_BIN44]|nr:IS1 family transposase [Phormidesmis sp. CAN_BIN44]
MAFSRLNADSYLSLTRLTRKTICFSKSIQMHDIVLGLFMNRFEFGRSV